MPIEDHFDDESIDVLREALDKHQPDEADIVIDLAEKKNGKSICYDALRYGILLYRTCSTEVLREATWDYIFDIYY